MEHTTLVHAGMLVLVGGSLGLMVWRQGGQLDEVADQLASMEQRLAALPDPDALADMQREQSRQGRQLSILSGRLRDLQGDDGGPPPPRREEPADELGLQPLEEDPAPPTGESAEEQAAAQAALDLNNQITNMLNSMGANFDANIDRMAEKLRLSEKQVQRLEGMYEEVEVEYNDLFRSFQEGETDKEQLRENFWELYDGMDETLGDVLNDRQMNAVMDRKNRMIGQYGSWLPELVGGGSRGEVIEMPLKGDAQPQ